MTSSVANVEANEFVSPAKHSGHTTVFSSAPPKIQSGTTKLLQQLLRSGQKGLQIYKLEPTVAAPRATKRGDMFSTPGKQDPAFQKAHSSASKSANKIPLALTTDDGDRENVHPNTPSMSRESSKEAPALTRETSNELPVRTPLFSRGVSEDLKVTSAELVYDTDAAPPNPVNDDGTSEYDAGIFWKVKNNKYIAVNFGPESVAKRVGVRPGDILRSVDGVDILGFQVDDRGHHPADDLLLGKQGSLCSLKFLRVAQPDADAIKTSCTKLVEFSVSLKRTSYVEDVASDQEEEVPKPNMVFSPLVK